MSIHKQGSISLLKDNLIAMRFFWQHSSQIREIGFNSSERKNLWKIARYTQVSLFGIRALIDCAARVNEKQIPGAFVECGVWRGGSAAILSEGAKNANRELWLFDSFEGMPEGTEEDTDENSEKLSTGRSSGSLEAVGTNVAPEQWVSHLLLNRFQYPKDNLHIRKGWFQNTTPKSKSEIGPIALLRLDGDFYESTKVCLDELYPQVSPGGIVILDDYQTFVGCRKAFEDYFSGSKPPELNHISGNQGVWFYKE